MSKTTRVYKVVAERPNGLVSAFVERRGLRRVYCKTKTTWPAKGTKLFAFLSKQEAFNYAERVHQVFLAEATGVHHNGWFEDSYPIEEARRQFANPNIMGRPTLNYQSCVCCDSIRLIKRMK